MKNRFYNLLSLLLIFQMSFSQLSGQSQHSLVPVQSHDTSVLDWKLWGYRPNYWKMDFDFDKLSGNWAEYAEIDFKIPGSVQMALKNALVIEDWNIGLNSKDIEWIENRHWLITTRIPDTWIADKKKQVILECKGLDYKGFVYVNGKEIGQFDNAFIPYTFDITENLKERNNSIVFVFECPPAYLGQIGYTSQVKDWKPRFNYGWDWVPRIVQTGIWDDVFLYVKNKDTASLSSIQVLTDADKRDDKGSLSIKAEPDNRALKGNVKVELTSMDGEKILSETLSTNKLSSGIIWDNLTIKRWYPNGLGDQVLYTLNLILYDENDVIAQQNTYRVGFRNLEWLPTKGAPANADHWLCSVNNQSFFLQGINWTPIRPNFADLTQIDYQKLLKSYKKMGVNAIRIWGGGFPEKDWLYDICDDLGILIWQDFPLSSSGLDNYPPDGAKEIYEITEIARHYVTRLEHHPSLMLWCGGNELYQKGDVAPITDTHKMIAAIKQVVKSLDPTRKFVPGSPSGPTISNDPSLYNQAVSWDVHGPWKLPFTQPPNYLELVKNYWTKNDAMMHSEAGVPGAMSVEMMEKYNGEYEILPANIDNPLWRNVNWWIQWNEYLSEGKSPDNLKEYVTWSQQRQADGLYAAVKAAKNRFPGCGGFFIWMGHDSFPCMENTSIFDFEGNPKPVVKKLSEIFNDNTYLKQNENN